MIEQSRSRAHQLNRYWAQEMRASTGKELNVTYRLCHTQQEGNMALRRRMEGGIELLRPGCGCYGAAGQVDTGWLITVLDPRMVSTPRIWRLCWRYKVRLAPKRTSFRA
jgi:hypothetical protein